MELRRVFFQSGALTNFLQLHFDTKNLKLGHNQGNVKVDYLPLIIAGHGILKTLEICLTPSGKGIVIISS
jgi:hypothetical protein